jgi:hypothetical protein
MINKCVKIDKINARRRLFYEYIDTHIYHISRDISMDT